MQFLSCRVGNRRLTTTWHANFTKCEIRNTWRHFHSDHAVIRYERPKSQLDSCIEIFDRLRRAGLVLRGREICDSFSDHHCRTLAIQACHRWTSEHSEVGHIIEHCQKDRNIIRDKSHLDVCRWRIGQCNLIGDRRCLRGIGIGSERFFVSCQSSLKRVWHSKWWNCLRH